MLLAAFSAIAACGVPEDDLEGTTGFETTTGGETGADDGETGDPGETGDEGGDVDQVPPTVEIVDPQPGAITGGETTIEVDAADDVGVAQVEILIDGESFAKLGQAPWTVDWNPLGDDAGDVEITAVARDAAGNEAESSVVVSNISSGGSGGTYPGDVDESIEVDGFFRDYYLYVPSTYDPATPTPLLTVHHGAGGKTYKGEYYRDYWRQTAEANGFILLSQDSLDDSQGGWLDQDKDFWVEEVTHTLEAYNVDRSRIYVWGFSAGGHFAHYLGMSFPTFITAYAVHSGTLGPFHVLAKPAMISRKIPVAIWVGTTDPNGPSCANTRNVFEDAGWVLGEDLGFTEFPGGHEAPKAQLPDVWAFLSEWQFE